MQYIEFRFGQSFLCQDILGIISRNLNLFRFLLDKFRNTVTLQRSYFRFHVFAEAVGDAGRSKSPLIT